MYLTPSTLFLPSWRAFTEVLTIITMTPWKASSPGFTSLYTAWPWPDPFTWWLPLPLKGFWRSALLISFTRWMLSPIVAGTTSFRWPWWLCSSVFPSSLKPKQSSSEYKFLDQKCMKLFNYYCTCTRQHSNSISDTWKWPCQGQRPTAPLPDRLVVVAKLTKVHF